MKYIFIFFVVISSFLSHCNATPKILRGGNADDYSSPEFFSNSSSLSDSSSSHMKLKCSYCSNPNSRICKLIMCCNCDAGQYSYCGASYCYGCPGGIAFNKLI